jgi:hypothetical protein
LLLIYELISLIASCNEEVLEVEHPRDHLNLRQLLHPSLQFSLQSFCGPLVPIRVKLQR